MIITITIINISKNTNKGRVCLYKMLAVGYLIPSDPCLTPALLSCHRLLCVSLQPHHYCSWQSSALPHQTLHSLAVSAFHLPQESQEQRVVDKDWTPLSQHRKQLGAETSAGQVQAIPTKARKLLTWNQQNYFRRSDRCIRECCVITDAKCCILPAMLLHKR